MFFVLFFPFPPSSPVLLSFPNSFFFYFSPSNHPYPAVCLSGITHLYLLSPLLIIFGMIICCSSFDCLPMPHNHFFQWLGLHASHRRCFFVGYELNSVLQSRLQIFFFHESFTYMGKKFIGKAGGGERERPMNIFKICY